MAAGDSFLRPRTTRTHAWSAGGAPPVSDRNPGGTWSFANDVHTEAQGKRLFAIVGFGQSLGAVAGSAISLSPFQGMDLYVRLLGAGVLLLGCLALTWVVHRRERVGGRGSATPEAAQSRLSGAGGFQLVLRHRYLLLIGLMTLMIQFVNTNGEWILAETITATAFEQVGGASGANRLPSVSTPCALTSFYTRLSTVRTISDTVVGITIGDGRTCRMSASFSRPDPRW